MILFIIINKFYLVFLGSLAESINSWSSMSMTTSIQMAQECLRQDPTLANPQDNSQSFEGLEAFAQTIESGILKF